MPDNSDLSLPAQMNSSPRPLDSDTTATLVSWFAYLSALPGSEQHSFIESLEKADPTRAAELAQLFSAHQRLQRAELPLVDLPEGTRVGRFVVEAKHAEGGMGAVYRGKRDDGTIEQMVAIKIARFEPLAFAQIQHEASLLSRLRHPDIAQFFDVELLGPGQLAIIMEWIDGKPLDQAVEGVDATTIIRFGQRIAEALAYAHDQRVLHGDVKPGNVLVTNSGEVKLIDFGIGVMLGENEELPALGLTEKFASPQLLERGVVSAKADVFALGKTLEQLLGEVAKQKEIAKPKHRIKDLNAVLKSSMSRDVNTRYDANVFSSELGRLQIGQWVVARNQERFSSLRAITRSYPKSIAASALVAGTLVGLSAALYLSNLEANRAGQLAQSEAKSAEQTTQFLLETIRQASPEAISPETLTVKELAVQADARIASANLNSATRQRLLLALAEIDRASARYEQSFAKLTAIDQQRPVASIALQTKRLRLESLLDSGSKEIAQKLVAELTPNERWALASPVVQFLNQQADFKSAEKLAFEKLVQATAIEERIELLTGLARAQHELGKFDAALVSFQQIEVLIANHPTSAFKRYNLNLQKAKTLRLLGRLEEANTLSVEALETLEKRLGADHPAFASALLGRGYEEYYAGEYKLAIANAEKAQRILEARFGTTFYPRLVDVYDLLAKNYALIGDAGKAVDLCFEAIGKLETDKGASPRDLALIRFDLGSYLTVKRRYVEALTQLELALDHFENSSEREGIAPLFIKSRMLMPLQRLSRNDDALALVNQLVPQYKLKLPKSHQALTELLVKSAVIANAVNADATALSYAKEAAMILLDPKKQAHPAQASVLIPQVLPILDEGKETALATQLREITLSDLGYKK
jgi:eukaryotic-like serine/threonine-protein kinase